MPVSDAKKKANARWNASKDNIMIRVNKDVGAEIRATAAAAGKSVTQFVLDAVMQKIKDDRMEQEAREKNSL